MGQPGERKRQVDVAGDEPFDVGDEVGGGAVVLGHGGQMHDLLLDHRVRRRIGTVGSAVRPEMLLQRPTLAVPDGEGGFVLGIVVDEFGHGAVVEDQGDGGLRFSF